MRPKAIVYFEWIIFGTLLLGVLQSYLGRDRAMAIGPRLDPSLRATFLLSIWVCIFVLTATMTLLVSRRRSRIAMWVSIALFAFGLPAVLQLMMNPGQLPGSPTISVVQFIGQVVAFGVLFTPSARRWMNRKNETLRAEATTADERGGVPLEPPGVSAGPPTTTGKWSGT